MISFAPWPFKPKYPLERGLGGPQESFWAFSEREQSIGPVGSRSPNRRARGIITAALSCIGCGVLTLLTLMHFGEKRYEAVLLGYDTVKLGAKGTCCFRIYRRKGSMLLARDVTRVPSSKGVTLQ